MMGRLVFGLQCHVGAYKDTFFPRTLSTPNGTVTLLCVPSLRSWKKIKLTKPIFSSMALRLTQRTCLWHSWTTCLRTESFLKPFGLQDLRIFLSPIFFSGLRWKTQCIRKIPTQLMSWRWPSQNTSGMWTVLNWPRSSRIEFGVSINVWGLAGDSLNITCNFLYCNHQMDRNFLITLYMFPFRAKSVTISQNSTNQILHVFLRFLSLVDWNM